MVPKTQSKVSAPPGYFPTESAFDLPHQTMHFAQFRDEGCIAGIASKQEAVCWEFPYAQPEWPKVCTISSLHWVAIALERDRRTMVTFVCPAGEWHFDCDLNPTGIAVVRDTPELFVLNASRADNEGITFLQVKWTYGTAKPEEEVLRRIKFEPLHEGFLADPCGFLAMYDGCFVFRREPSRGVMMFYPSRETGEKQPGVEIAIPYPEAKSAHDPDDGGYLPAHFWVSRLVPLGDDRVHVTAHANHIRDEYDFDDMWFVINLVTGEMESHSRLRYHDLPGSGSMTGMFQMQPRGGPAELYSFFEQHSCVDGET